MVSEEYLKEVAESLKYLKPLVPENHKIFFECLASPDEDATSFDECFILASQDIYNPAKWLPRKSELMIHILLMGPALAQNKRAEKVKEWLTAGENVAVAFICNELVSSKNNPTEFIPDKFPEEYGYYGDCVSFSQVL